ncbi:MAG: zinc-ribbon domain-containing protein, partial [bacterium]
MFCPQCGQENEPGAIFCSHCGYRLQAPEAKRGNKNVFIWTLIAILVLALGVGLYFLISSFLLSPPLTFMNLPQSVPGNSGLYLSFTSTQGSLLEFFQAFKTSWSIPGIENPFKELEADPQAQELLSQIKPNVQLALAWNKENPDFYLIGEIKDQNQAEKLLTQLADQYEQQGKRVEKKTVEGNLLVGFPEENTWISLKGGCFYASSSEEGLLSLFQKNPSSLENSSPFRSIKDQVPQNSSFFLFINFSQIPDIPSEISYFYLYADEREAHPHYKGQLVLDLKKLLSNPPTKELKGIYGVLLNLTNLPPETETPFQVTPPDSAFALTTFGWLGDLLKAVGSENLLPLASFDLSFLNGKMELFSSPSDSETQYPLGLAFQVDQSNYSKAQQFLTQLE